MNKEEEREKKQEKIRRKIIQLAINLHCGIDERKDKIIIFLPDV